jgi:hypothetical protein
VRRYQKGVKDLLFANSGHFMVWPQGVFLFAFTALG